MKKLWEEKRKWKNGKNGRENGKMEENGRENGNKMEIMEGDGKNWNGKIKMEKNGRENGTKMEKMEICEPPPPCPPYLHDFGNYGDIFAKNISSW